MAAGRGLCDPGGSLHGVQHFEGQKQRVSKLPGVETDAEKRNLGQMCHARICRRTEPAESTMPLISLELSDTESSNFTHI